MKINFLLWSSVIRILVSGGTGFVGLPLLQKLIESGHEIILITRSVESARAKIKGSCRFIEWEVGRTLQLTSEPIDGVINLAGAGVADKPWTAKRKKEILNSRLDISNEIISALNRSDQKPQFAISASAIGIYKDSNANPITEDSLKGDDFLAGVCKEWEKIWSEQSTISRTAILRIGIVLGKGGGIIKRILPVFRLGLGGRLGDGKQFMSWIHIDDVIQIIENAIGSENYQGIINGVAPGAVTNATFTKEFSRIIRRPSLFPVPSKILKVALGEMSNLLLASHNVQAKRLENLGYRHKYNELSEALKDIVS